MTGSRRAAAAVLALAALWLSATLGWRALMPPDEGRYAGVAWAMLHGDPWVPTLAGLPFFHKPPLFYWIGAAAMAVGGAHAWAARVPSLLGALAAALALYLFTRRHAGERLARWSVVALVTQPFVFVGAQFANLDMLVAGCIAACVLLAAHAVLAPPGRGARAAAAAAWGLAGLGLLAKGLIGPVLPALVLLAWLAATRRLRALPRLLAWPGPLLFVAVAAPWCVAMQARYPGFFHYFFIVQHVERFTQAGFNNPQPFWFYLPVLALLTLPWSGWLLARVMRRGAPPRMALQPLHVLMACWIGVVLLFFSLPTSKLVGYVLPATPPLAFLLADAALRWGSSRARRLTVALAAALCLGGVAVADHVARQRSTQPLAAVIASGAGPHEPIVFAGRFLYDLPFLAGGVHPLIVVDDWHSGAPLADGWRRELRDAGAFAPRAAAHTLVDWGDAPARLCALPSFWLVASDAGAQRLGVPAGRPAAARAGTAGVWHVAPGRGAALTVPACAGRPSGDPAGR